MLRKNIERLRASYKWFAPCGPALIATVLRNLGDYHPGVRALFPEDTSHLHRRFFETLGQVVKSIHRFHSLEAPLADLGRRAAAEGANPGTYRIVRDELLTVMAELAGDDWTQALAEDWEQLLDAMIGAMLAGTMPEELRKAA